MRVHCTDKNIDVEQMEFACPRPFRWKKQKSSAEAIKTDSWVSILKSCAIPFLSKIGGESKETDKEKEEGQRERGRDSRDEKEIERKNGIV